MALRTEADIAALRPLITEYPERRVVTPSYPPLRRKRGLKPDEQAALGEGDLGALTADGLSAVPSVRLWTISIHGGTLDDTFQDSSPPYSGPGLIDFLALQELHTPGATRYETFQMSYSEAPGPRNALTATPAALPGTVFYDSTFADDVGAGATDKGLPIYPDATNRTYKLDLGIYVPYTRWYLNFAFTIRAAAIHRITGYFRIVENVIPLEST